MQSWWVRLKKWLWLLGFLLVPIVFFYVQKRVTTARGSMAGGVLGLAALIERPLVAGAGKISDAIYRYKRALSEQDEIVRLRNQLEDYRTLKYLARDAEIENRRLKNLLNFAADNTLPNGVMAHVIGRSGAPLSRLIQIDQGSKQGIKRGDAVVTAGGAVGQVLTVSNHASDVLLITDASSAIDVLVERSRARGIVHGRSDASRYMLRVADFDRLDDIKKNDVIVTAGIAAQFPNGIPVGIVTSVRPRQDGLYVEADIQPFVSMTKVEEVLVLMHGTPARPWRRVDMVAHQLQQTSR